ncbi:MAG: glycosyltransferase [Candidatus Limnocylindrales bacterium]|jgi:glycosyltransferase involved in cell wall biosynthesis
MTTTQPRQPGPVDAGPPQGERPLSLAFLGDPNSIHTRRWVGWFAAHGHRVTMLVPEGMAVDAGLPDTITVERFRPYTSSRPRLLGAFRARRSLAGVLGRIEPDVLHAHYLTVHGWHARMSGFRPYAITLWGTDILITARSTRRGRLYARWSLAPAGLVTGDSEQLVRAAVAAGARPERTHLVQFGVDTERFSPGPDPAAMRARLGLVGRRVVFSPRSIMPLYHHDVVLDAVASLPADLSVVMTDHLAHESEVAALRRRAADLGLSDRLVIVPRVAHGEMADIYRLADVVVSVPASDGTPVTLLEALSVGRPVVATDLPSVREWLGDLDPGSLVPVGDVAATVRAIDVALTRPQAESLDLARRGRQMIEERADHDRSMAAAEALYRDLLRRP